MGTHSQNNLQQVCVPMVLLPNYLEPTCLSQKTHKWLNDTQIDKSDCRQAQMPFPNCADSTKLIFLIAANYFPSVKWPFHQNYASPHWRFTMNSSHSVSVSIDFSRSNGVRFFLCLSPAFLMSMQKPNQFVL